MIEPIEFKPLDRPIAPAAHFRQPWLTWEKFAWFDLQWAHRVGSVALIVLIASVFGAFRDEGPYGSGLAATVVIADVGLMGGILGWWTSRRLARRTHEPMGVILFNLVILLLAASVYAAGHFGYLTPAVQWITNRMPAAS